MHTSLKAGFIAALIVVSGSVSSVAQNGEAPLNLNNYTDSVSYLLGMKIAQNLERENVRVNLDILCAGVEDVLNGVEAKLTPTQRMNVLLALQERGAELEARGELSLEKFAEKLYGKVSSNPPSRIKSSNDSISYCVGYNIGEEISSQQVGVNAFALVSAIRLIAANKPALLTETDILTLAMRLDAEAELQMRERDFDENRKRGTEFLERNGKRSEVVTLPSGLQYEVLEQGTGPTPTADDQVTVHYHGMLIDGTVFDSSIDRGQPVTFGVNKVIKGWIEALQLMPEGSRWKLYIPSELAYGKNGAGAKIEPHSTLIFEVELISVVR